MYCRSPMSTQSHVSGVYTGSGSQNHMCLKLQSAGCLQKWSRYANDVQHLSSRASSTSKLGVYRVTEVPSSLEAPR